MNTTPIAGTTLLRLPLVAFDEAGNTGQNLLDPEQPVFVASSVYLPEPVARDIIALAAPSGGQEAKFSKLRRSRAGPRRLLEALSHPAIAPEHVKLSAYHKRFMVTTKIVDLLVEPVLHGNGIDLYEGAANLGLANMWHAVTPAFCGQSEFDALLREFVRLVRGKTPETVDGFYQQVQRLRDMNRHPDFDSDLSMVLGTRDFVDEFLHDEDRTAIDPAIPAFVDLAAQWSATLGVPFEIVHDRSKPLEHEREQLESLMSLSDPGREIPNHGPTWRLPLLADGITFVESVAVAQVQVADLVSGAAVTVLDARAIGKVDGFTKELLATPFGQLSYSQVWPTTAVTPEELHADERPGSASLEYMMEVAQRGRERRGMAS